jgi:ferritin-like metal-binding protein YciE
MSDRLATYLNDHLAGASFAIEMLERMRDGCADPDLCTLAEELLIEIEDDRAVLQSIVEKFDSERSVAKEAAAWVAEKASRMKLQLGTDESLGVFETLEVLSLGILGKRALWRALEAVAAADTRLQAIDFNTLNNRAEAHYAAVEARRLEAARRVFVTG